MPQGSVLGCIRHLQPRCGGCAAHQDQCSEGEVKTQWRGTNLVCSSIPRLPNLTKGTWPPQKAVCKQTRHGKARARMENSKVDRVT